MRKVERWKRQDVLVGVANAKTPATLQTTYNPPTELHISLFLINPYQPIEDCLCRWIGRWTYELFSHQSVHPDIDQRDRYDITQQYSSTTKSESKSGTRASGSALTSRLHWNEGRR